MIYYDESHQEFNIQISSNDGERLNFLNKYNDPSEENRKYFVLQCSDIRDEKTIKSEGFSYIFDLEGDYNCQITFIDIGSLKGNFWINPINRDAPIDLTRIYANPAPLFVPDKGKKYTYIKYVISNLKNDTNVNFQYQSEFKNLDFNTQNLANPIKICKGDTEEQCEENIEMFVFKKDTVYSIYVNFEKREIENKNYYVLTGYSFKDINRRDYDEDRDDEDESERWK